ncbi:RNB domain-containing protein [Tessaracoccus bendigoensis DSM 12906]|uniref:RNB domain-containing protein n=1 Tax=Tessaracoccus bendigoensis DSM 12906 TaxID=1123357 RepID=A0A1M6MPF0_9ACTN|nr:RNB domain-containing ribonuclease [Tessaracoccus bendigoensis]SHJ85250.1 RNB domain-containing protein [Tessaracoccus bendigoensis DSM 12906]
MPAAHIAAAEVPAALRDGLGRLQARLGLPTSFPPGVLAEAEAVARLPLDGHVDRTDVEFVTIDPANSTDLDQALQLERDDDGFLVRYAIADVGHFVLPNTALEAETHRRGQTKYAPGARIPLHPESLSEHTASLLADGVPRPAMLWELQLDADGELRDVALTRALVRSRAKLSYDGVWADMVAGTPHPSIELLPTVGRLRQQREIDRGGVSLNLPEQEIVQRNGTWALEFRTMAPVENWNAQISLLTGFAAARTMLDAKVGILRTLPAAQQWTLEKLRRTARTLGVVWREGVSYPDFVRALSPEVPAQLAVLTKCTTVFRGAGYVAFNGELPIGNFQHAALAAPYAHTTAPLRRLVDRYVLEVCHSLFNGLPIPAWATDGLGVLPEEMAESGRSAKAYEAGVIDLTEALVLSSRVGEIFVGVVTDVNPKTGVGTVQIADPAVELKVAAKAKEIGSEVRVRIDRVDLRDGRVTATRPN